ncbi:YbaN family protein [Aquisalimonas lutea]|uniref:YbaN family protein n=1 Tax=Aquisalimonas lutea TaxID=1327750 RepID=UPI0025B483D2|nr:YbaN family protein [Aquisalimonas lutea]MDN3518486.1 YbaN family protein [Aquisalimonas lutea]
MPRSLFRSRTLPGIGPLARAPARLVCVVTGCVMVVLGLIGAFLPLMPTTIFMIIAAHCFGRSSPRLEAWILAQPRIGPLVKAWRAYGAIPRRAKMLACSGMACGFALFVVAARPGAPLALLVASLLIGAAIYIVSRPGPPVSYPPGSPGGEA